ncbi:hypothetical protein D9757_012553 [Collybiopsis confluens]|uniref:C2H2-type domain-containing protein n=1 Tax=Collybiopsis confluens TaxID=2823264 RepID=A0A8H5D893_9AGAR|nr:hypothetical protein D9757_012553 [Collybiopsis confluens]
MAVASAPISLPSIHEMFPEHLMKMAPDHRLRSPRTLIKHDNPKLHLCSFDVLRSDPSSSSLLHLASSATLPNRVSASQRPSRTVEPSTSAYHLDSGSLPSPSSSEPSPSSPNRPLYPQRVPPLRSSSDLTTYSSEDMSDDGDDKKHVCTTCHKRFNRPSSLRIHMNTHTGATPFRCPYPNCGREFNVNSNMRRHYRNHSTAASNRSQVKDDPIVSASARRRKSRSGDSSLASSQSGIRSPMAEHDFLVLRPDVPMYPSYETQAWRQQESALRPFTHGPADPPVASPGESSEDSDVDYEEDELMDEDYPDHQPTSSYRLQPVSDFHVRPRYEQSDVRSLPPLRRRRSHSSNSTPPPSPSSL